MNTFGAKVWAVLGVVMARVRFLMVFLVAALVVGYWDTITNHVDKWTRPVVTPELVAGAASEIEYYCAMHPNIVRNEPGNCPICSMPLVKRKKGEKMVLPADVLARVQISPQRVALANIHTTAVEAKKLVREIHAVGVLDYDETKVAQLSARVAGRADRLFIQYVGQSVKQNDPVYSLYSPEVFTAQREYLMARKRVNELASDAPAEVKGDAAAVYNASLQKLVLWGISREQLDRADKEYDRTGTIPTNLMVTSPISGIVIKKDIFEGGYVQAGDTPYTIGDLTGLWLKAKIFEQDVPLVQIGQRVEVTVEAYPADRFEGVVTFRAFQVDELTRTMDARIEVKNGDLRLRPGMFADARIRVAVVADSGAGGRPASQPSFGVPGEGAQRAKVFYEGLQPYLEAQELLAADKGERVSELLHEAVAKLEPIGKDAAIAPAYKRLTEGVHGTMGKDIAGIRVSFKEISAAMIEIGKAAGLPPDAMGVQVFRCPMVKANWLQKTGTTANPYYGSSMLTCGAAIEDLPRTEAKIGPMAHALPEGEVLAVPRSAVIDTGRNRIVYVQSSEGVFDMRAVKLGLAAGDFYPVESGLEEGDRVVTVGAFLVDAENRLNPGS